MDDLFSRCVPKRGTLDVHIRLTKSKRVDVRFVVEIRKAVVHESVGRLVAADSVEHIDERGVRLETPIVLRNFWRREVLPVGYEIVSDGRPKALMRTHHSGIRPFSRSLMQRVLNGLVGQLVGSVEQMTY